MNDYYKNGVRIIFGGVPCKVAFNFPEADESYTSINLLYCHAYESRAYVRDRHNLEMLRVFRGAGLA